MFAPHFPIFPAGPEKTFFRPFCGAFWLPFWLHFGSLELPGAFHGLPEGVFGTSFSAFVFHAFFWMDFGFPQAPMGGWVAARLDLRGWWENIILASMLVKSLWENLIFDNSVVQAC